MWKNIAIAGATGAVILGAGATALAVTGTSGSTPSSPSTSSTSSTAPASPSTAKGGQRAKARAIAIGRKNFQHGTWVTKDGSTEVTHDAIRGSVTAVSATSITVKATDGVSQTYLVSSATKVHSRAAGKGKGKTGPITDVKPGDAVGVLGTGTTTLTATQILDRTH